MEGTLAMNEQSGIVQSVSDIEVPVTIGVEAYVSPASATDKGDRL